MEDIVRRDFQNEDGIILLHGAPVNVKSKLDGSKFQQFRFSGFSHIWNSWEPLFSNLGLPNYFTNPRTIHIPF